MKLLLFFLTFVCISLSVYAQNLASSSNILDSYVDWQVNTGTLILIVSDSSYSMQSVHVNFGSQAEGNDLLNVDYAIGSQVIVADNILQIPLGTFSSGDQFVRVTISLVDGSSREMDYKTTH